MTALRLVAALALITDAPADHVIRQLDLQSTFAASSPWRLTITQGPETSGPIAEGQPGALTLCLSRDGGRSCAPLPLGVTAGDEFDAPHYVDRVAIVRPRPTMPLLLVQVSSLHSGNGNQRRWTDLYRYDHANNRFVPVYRHEVGRNNNEEVRYVERGPLAGAMIAVEPTASAPFGFWISVDRPTAAGVYRPVLRYRSATRYGDGNPLAVIDSDMPELQRRLGLWRPGRPLPVPPHCAAPRLIRAELWCQPRPTP